jgi:hypothetical protein
MIIMIIIIIIIIIIITIIIIIIIILIPGIKAILRSAASPDRSALRGKAMECAGLVGEAVGTEWLELLCSLLISFG